MEKPFKSITQCNSWKEMSEEKGQCGYYDFKPQVKQMVKQAISG